MSISSSVRKAGPYTGNGSTTGFPFKFKVFAISDVLVIRTDPSAVESTLTLGTDYSVSLNVSQDSNPGGVVTLLSAPLAGYLLTITSAVKNLQPVVLTNNGGFYPAVINDALDRATILIQQLSEEVGRAFKVPISSTERLDVTVANYVAEAKKSASAAASSASTSGNSAELSEVYANASGLSASSAAGSAAAAATSAMTAAAPTGVALARYLDTFFPASQMVLFSAIYALGGVDLGWIETPSPFANEETNRRASLSGGAGNYDFGTVP